MSAESAATAPTTAAGGEGGDQPQNLSVSDALRGAADLDEGQLNELLGSLEEPDEEPAYESEEEPSDDDQRESDEEETGDEPDESGEPDEPDDEPDEPDFTKNFRLRAEDEKKSRFLSLLRQEPGSNPITLAIRAGYDPSEIQGLLQQQQAAVPHQQEQAPDPIEPLRKQVADIEAELATAQEEFRSDDIPEIINRLSEAKARVIVEERVQKLEARTNEVLTRQQWEAQHRNEVEAAYRQYPELTKKGTPQYSLVAAEVARIQIEEPHLMNNPAYVWDVIEKVKADHPALFQAKAKPKTIQKPTTHKKPKGEVVSPTNGVQPYSTKQIVEMIKGMSDADMAKVAHLMV